MHTFRLKQQGHKLLRFTLPLDLPDPPNMGRKHRENDMNIEVKTGRKEGTVNLVMGQVSAAFLLEVAGNAVEAQAAKETGMAAQMFGLLVAECRTALAEVKAMVPDPFAGTNGDDKPADDKPADKPADENGNGDGDGDGDDKVTTAQVEAAEKAATSAVAQATGKGTKVDVKA